MRLGRENSLLRDPVDLVGDAFYPAAAAALGLLRRPNGLISVDATGAPFEKARASAVFASTIYPNRQIGTRIGTHETEIWAKSGANGGENVYMHD